MNKEFISINNKIKIYEHISSGKEFLKEKEPTKENFVDFLIENIKEASERDFRFKDPRNLKDILTVRLFDENIENLEDISSADYPLEKILSQTQVAAKSLYEMLPSKNCVNVYLFPAADSFARTKMNGVNGYTPESGTIFLFLDYNTAWDGNFFKGIEGGLAHEYNHSVRFFYFSIDDFQTLRDAIVNEGLAENFQMNTFDLSPSPWVEVLDRKGSKEIFNKVQDNLDSSDYGLYKDLFFGSDDYPLWAGYAVGYHLVNDFLRNKGDDDWSAIMETNSEVIVKESGWI